MLKVALYGNYATQFLLKPLKKSFKDHKLNAEFYLAEYNQAELEFYDSGSALFSFNPDYIILHECVENLRDTFYSHTPDLRFDFANTNIGRLQAFSDILKTSLPKAKLFYPSWENDRDMVFGNFFPNVADSFDYQVNKFNWNLIELVASQKNLLYIDSARIANQAAEPKNFSLAISADLHFSFSFLQKLSNEICNSIKAISGGGKKCVILDLDNTLWGGIIGDDGIENIEIGTLGIGKAFSRLQKWLKELKSRGIILAVCSKNNHDTAIEPFEKHAEMILHLSDIAVFVANWETKADNIRYIQQVLNIGFDSIVFLDDNPAERQIVRDNLPDVTVPELPEDPTYYLDYIKSINLFETGSFSANDKDRTRQYQEEAKRVELSKSVVNIEDYLKSLEMKAIIEPFAKEDYSRIAQLTQRSNQFNLRTVRYTEADIERIANDTAYCTIAVKLKDKFGDYGLISIIIISVKGENAFIENWLMSCRVLKRGVEHLLTNMIAEMLSDKQVKTITAEYIPTAKNALVLAHYQNLGFTTIGDNLFELPTAASKQFETYITVSSQTLF